MTAEVKERFRLSAHLGYLFQELPLAARFEAANRAGFRAIEIPDPYSLDKMAFRSLCQQNDLEVAQIALPNGTSEASRKGLAALPGSEAEFHDALMLSIDFAKAVSCPLIHPMSGTGLSIEDPAQWAVYLSNISKACTAAADDGLSVIIEPISPFGAPNYFMNSLPLACAAIASINAPNLFLSLDTYHCAAMGVQFPSFISGNGATIAHVQVADWPRRDEPGSGEINFDAIFTQLHICGYKGFIGLEYIPSSTSQEPFEWVRAFSEHFEPLRMTPHSFGTVTPTARP